MSKKSSGLCLIAGLILGGAGDYFVKIYIDNINKKEIREESKLIGTLNLKTDDTPYLPLGHINAYDGKGISYAIFYNTIEGTASISESKMFSNNSSIVSDNNRISF